MWHFLQPVVRLLPPEAHYKGCILKGIWMWVGGKVWTRHVWNAYYVPGPLANTLPTLNPDKQGGVWILKNTST